MSLPLLHSLAGYSIYRISKQDDQTNWKLALTCIVLANAPDLDFVPGILMGRASHFHHGNAHSFGAAILCGLFAVWINKVRKKAASLRIFFIGTAAYASHILLDYINDAHEGLPLFWPLTSHQFPVSISFFAPATWGPPADGGLVSFIYYVFSLSNLKRLATEITIASSIGMGLSLISELKKRRQIKTPALLFKEK